MCSDIIVKAENLTKCYQMYDKPQDRLKQTLWRGRKQYYRNFYALRDVSFELKRGEVLGIVGMNGAGKSTLLQLICGTLTPSSGDIHINGRISALLELGSGFHPDFTGRENVYMNASILGLSRDEIDARYDTIVQFSGIGDFIDQPVKIYSSGMLMRLAFSVASHVDPDVLIVDEALSVGDGTFSRKSFDRIIAMKDEGRTLCFCSHSMHQVDQLCDRVLWLDQGATRMFGKPEPVIAAYNDFLCSQEEDKPASLSEHSLPAVEAGGNACLTEVKVLADGVGGKKLTIYSKKTALTIEIAFKSDVELPTPSVAVIFLGTDGRVICSCSPIIDGIELERDKATGAGHAVVNFPDFPLLRGNYSIDVYLICEKGIFFYDAAVSVATIEVIQEFPELGVVSIQHAWRQ